LTERSRRTHARIIQTALDSFGRLDILVNNAGIVRPRIIHDMSESDWDDVIAVHMKGTFSTIGAAAMIFREHKGGVIVNTASESGLGHLGQSSYSAAKEGIVGFTRTIAPMPVAHGRASVPTHPANRGSGFPFTPSPLITNSAPPSGPGSMLSVFIPIDVA